MAVDVQDSTTASGSTRNAGPRWALFALLVGVLVAGIAVSATIVLARGAGDGLSDRVGSLSDPPADVAKEREKVLAAGRTFVQRFNTYGPDLLQADGTMPEYAAVGDLMTAKFAKVFADNVGYAEQTVKETGIDRVAEVYGVGVAALDNDSALLLVGGIVNFSYPDPDNTSERVPFEPLRFRYEVSLVRQDGRWLVDDLDDLDDDLPSFADASDPQTTPSQAPGDEPSGSPSGSPTDSPEGSPDGTPEGTPDGTPEGSPDGTPEGSPSEPADGGASR